MEFRKHKTIRRITILFFLFSFQPAFSQTTISGGNVSGTWTKANSPYKINGNIAIPNGSTLTIEPGVVIQFAQFKYMNVDGRIIAVGGNKTTDSIWFTKQNPNDTGSWKGVKFVKTANTNDTSMFKYCVFRNCKSLNDTTYSNLSGGITILGFGKVKVANSTFYKNEASSGASIFLTKNAYAVIKTCTFKNNSACRFWWWDGTNYNGTKSKGSAIAIDFNSNGIIDSCVFKNNIRGKDYFFNPSILYEASTVDVEGFSYYNQRAYATISNSVFDGNEGVTLHAYDLATVSVTNCTFINAPKGKSKDVVYAHYYSYIGINQSSFTDNKANCVLSAEDSKMPVSNCSILRNENVVSSRKGTSTLTIEGCKILNNYGALDQTDNSIVGGFGANKISNTLIANNNYHTMSAGSINNSTIVNNRSSKGGLLAFSYLYCNNSIIWGNNADSAIGKQIIIYPSTIAEFRNCIIQNDTAAFGWMLNGMKLMKPTTYQDNLSSNPQFVNPTMGVGSGYNASLADFSLKNTCALLSPAINAGKTDTLYMMLPCKKKSE